ncbi:MAG: VOC family protein [Actinomycetota bacterium]|nr:VOC family protein [Actinomycetota bacterium]
MITGISHVAFAVENLQVSFDFYVEILGCQPVARWSSGAYLLAGEVWITLLCAETRSDNESSDYTHVAFSVFEAEFDDVAERVRRSGARTWQENQTQGHSLYFTDPDGHKLELATSTLAARLAADRDDPPEGMRFFV